MILVVDDCRDICGAVVRVLTAMRYAALGVTGGREAIDYLRDERPDLMLLDCNMPDVDGVEVLRHVRGDPRLAEMPVVMLSGDLRPALRAELERAGIQGWILKDHSSYDEIRDAALRYGVPA